MDTTAKDFMNEVKDNFLTCPLCRRDFDRPKTLPCMHTFCHDCLVKYADDLKSTEESRQTYRYSSYSKPLTCPVCKRRTDITSEHVSTLPDNFLITSLISIIRDKAEESTACQICKRGRHKGRRPAAVRRCLECSKQLCKRCVTQHQETKVTQAHTLYDMQNVDKLMCAEHVGEHVRFICKTCCRCICVFCTHTSHSGHEVMSITEGTATCPQEMDIMVDNCTKRIQAINSQLKYIQSWESSYQQTREHIITTATEFLTQIESQRQAFLSKLDEMFGEGAMEILNKKDMLLESLDDLSSACKYKEVIPEDNSIESVLVQSELQNKVKSLLNIPLPVSHDFQCSDISITFEKGDIQLGSLLAVTEDNDERKEEYYDGTEEGRQSRIWCRNCRSQTRSQSLPGSLRENLLDRETGETGSGLTSDTDFSLTDVSQLDVHSSHQLLVIGAGDTEYSINTSDFGVQVTSTDGLDIPTYSQSLEEDRRLCVIPDVVPYCVQTTDSSCQYEYDVTDKVMVNSACQYEQVLLSKTTQDSSCQYEATQTNDSTCQHDVTFAHTTTQAGKAQSASTAMSTDIIFDLKSTDIGVSGLDMSTNLPVSLVPSDVLRQVVPVADVGSMTSMPAVMVDGASNTDVVQSVDMSMMTESKQVRDIAVDKYTLQSCDQSTQTVQEPKRITVDFCTNTDSTSSQEQTTQTSQHKMKSRGVSVRPSMAEYGLDVKPSTSEIPTNTEQVSRKHGLTQTEEAQIIYNDQATCTDQLVNHQTKGTSTVHFTGLNSCTSTYDLISLHASSAQTDNHTKHTTDMFTNTEFTSPKTVSCGLDNPFYGTQSVGIATEPAAKTIEISTNTISVKKSDSWTNPVITTKSSKASGTEQVKKRTVGLYVRPSQKDSASMTANATFSDKGCGWSFAQTADVCIGESPALCDQTSDTTGLINLCNTAINTQVMSKASHSCQTPVVSTCDTFTTMMEALLLDKATNTPHQIAQEVLDQFDYPPHSAAEYCNRTTQTDIMSDFTIPANGAVSESPGLSMYRTNLASQHSNNVSLSSLSSEAAQTQGTATTSPTQSKPSQATSAPPDSSADPTQKRSYSISSKSVTVKPQMYDKCTSTVTLSTLLHTERLQSSTDSNMDNKISECISKLRLVTKKLQKSSTDVSKSAPSSCSSPITDSSGFETPMSQVSNLQEDLDYEEACSSILSLPAGYITGASNECSRRFSVPGKDTGGDDQAAVRGLLSPPSFRRPDASPSTHPHTWDLKSLVHEEDRVRRGGANSSTQPPTQGAANSSTQPPGGSDLRWSTSGRSTPASEPRAYRSARRNPLYNSSSNSGSQYSSRYNSTESLNNLDPENPVVKESLSSSVVSLPVSSPKQKLRRTKTDISPVRQRTSKPPASNPTSKHGKTTASSSKARAKYLDPAALLGVEKTESQEDNKQPSAVSEHVTGSRNSKPPSPSNPPSPNKTPSPNKQRLMSSRQSHGTVGTQSKAGSHSTVRLPKQLVNTVVRKVMGHRHKQKSPDKNTDSTHRGNRSSNTPKTRSQSLRPIRTERVVDTSSDSVTKSPQKLDRTSGKTPTTKYKVTSSSKANNPLTASSDNGLGSSSEFRGEKLAFHNRRDRSLERYYSLSSSSGGESEHGCNVPHSRSKKS